MFFKPNSWLVVHPNHRRISWNLKQRSCMLKWCTQKNNKKMISQPISLRRVLIGVQIKCGWRSWKLYLSEQLSLWDLSKQRASSIVVAHAEESIEQSLNALIPSVVRHRDWFFFFLAGAQTHKKGFRMKKKGNWKFNHLPLSVVHCYVGSSVWGRLTRGISRIISFRWSLKYRSPATVVVNKPHHGLQRPSRSSATN